MKTIIITIGFVFLGVTSAIGQAGFPRQNRILYMGGPAYNVPTIPTIINPGAGYGGLDEYVYCLYTHQIGASNAIVRRQDNGVAPNFAVYSNWNGNQVQGGGCPLFPALQVITTSVGSVSFTDRRFRDRGTFQGVDEFGYEMYSHTCNAPGDPDSYPFTITVVDFNWINYGAISEMCLNESAIALSDFISYTTGVTYSGPGVVNGVFTPAAAGVGTHIIVANRTFDNGSIGRNLQITVRELPNVSFTPPAGVCNDGVSYNLPSYVSNWAAFTGSFSGPGVAGAFFIPNSAGGNGNKAITYTSGANAYGCSNSLVGNINVIADYSATAGNAQSVCQGATLNLTGAGPAGGAWSTNDCVGCVSANQFNSAGVTVGAKTLTYTVNQGGCQRSANKTVSVIALPLVEAGNNLSSCANASPIDLTLGGVNPSGGSWSSSDNTVSNAINNGNATLNPNSISSGDYSVAYTVTVNNCSNTDTRTLTINAPPSVNAGNDEATCLNGGTLALAGGNPAGGTWSGTGVTGSTFNPLTAGTGSHVITYSYNNGTCSNTDTKIITVNTAGPIDAGPNSEVCINSGMFPLVGGSPGGGTWSGVGVSGNQFNSSLPAGNYVVTYTTTSNGCQGSDTRTITINPLPSVEAGNNLVTCTNAVDFNLTGASPGGGVWSGNGLNGPSLFSPILAGQGQHVMTYTYTNGNGCTNQDTRTITVNSPTPVVIGGNQTFCSNSAVYNLNADLSAGLTGGVWSGSGVSGNNFNPSNVSPGAYSIAYAYTNANGCVSTQNKEFTVVPGPSIDAGPTLEVCANQGLVNLVGASPIGGTWSGFGIQGDQFDPSITSIGVFNLTYTYATAACVVSDVRQVVVYSSTSVDAGNNLNSCANAADFLLTGASVNGGVWNGPGVAGGFFSPTAAGPGTHLVTYVYTNNHGCQSNDTRLVTVNDVPAVNAGDDVIICSNAGIYNLISNATPVGGTFSGTGVVALNFNPAIAGVGVHQINYTYTNPANGCSRTDFRYITVIAPQAVTVGTNLTACIDSPPILLTGQSIPGGTWSGNSVVADNFSPATAGEGVHQLTYTVVDGNGCSATANKTVSVTALPVVEAGPDLYVCSGSPLVALNGTGAPIGGTFTGANVVGGNFDVTSSGSGIFQVTYTFTNPLGCSSADTKNIIVDAGAVVNAGSDFTVCAGDPLVDLASRVSPGGGVFVGPGVVGNNFNTSLGTGTYQITYSLENGYGCVGDDSFTITVNALPQINAGSDVSLCFNQTPYNLALTAVPAGGDFFGPGVVGNLIDPSIAGVGEHVIYYHYTNASGCSATETRTITVTELPPVNAGANQFLCTDGNLVDLSVGASPQNGSWSGAGITNGIFNPVTAGPGVHVLNYSVALGNGCTNTDQKIITVFSQLNIDAGQNLQVCSNSSLVNLANGASVVNGTWTGTSVTGQNFNPAVGPGTYQVTLNYTNFYGCSAYDTKTITVIAPQSVSVGSDLSMCVTAANINLANSAIPPGGTFNGSGVMSNTFNPSLAGIGSHSINYNVTDALGCVSNKTRIIQVTAPPAIDAGPNKVLCLSSAPLDLDIGASITGGTWNGASIDGSFFDPQTAGLGTYIISYTYNDGFGCISQDNKTITVRENATVDAGANLEVCVNSSSVDLNPQVSRSGGSWSGVGMTNSIFSPATAGPGTHMITYRYTDNFGCSAEDSKTIVVNDKPAVSVGSPLMVCATANQINLNSSAFPAGGSWSGPGITGSYFNPQAVGLGTYNASYSVTNASGCSQSVQKVITVQAPPSIDTGPNVTVCLATPLVDLDLSSNVSGGVWSGVGVSNNTFDPSFAGVGNFILTYAYNDGQGCISTDTRTIIVRNNPTVNAGADQHVCINANPLNLSLQVSSGVGGVWSGTGVTSSGVFTPSIAGLGVKALKYTYSDSYGCVVNDFVNIDVNPIPVINAGPDREVCSTSPIINLNQSAFPSTNGSWSGAGVINGIFDPASVSVGDYNAIFTYTNLEGCTATDTKTIVVVSPPVVGVGANAVLCLNSSRLDLTSVPGVVGGTWSGFGLEGNFFNPALAGAGSHQLNYQYDHGLGCLSNSVKTIIVRENLTVNSGNGLILCNNAQPVLLTDVSLPGGVWSGPAISGTFFNPAVAGVGTHILTYSVTDEFGCHASDTRNVLVNGATTLDAGPPASICTTAQPLQLINAVNEQGGTFSGPGILNNAFNPGSTGPGVYTVLYTLTNYDGCTSSDTRQITVTIPAQISIGANQILCQNSPRLDLDLSTNQLGGTWSGSQGLEASFFNPALVPVGNHRVTYSYDNGQGCISSSSKTIQVRSSIAVNAGPDRTICRNAPSVNLTGDASRAGGVWSGNGISGSNFNPAIADIGEHVLSYRYQDEFGCTAEDSKLIIVPPLPAVNAGPDINACSDAPPVSLANAGFPTGGAWSGQGVIDNLFDPAVVGSGNFTLTYRYVDPNNCVGTDTRNINVTVPPIVNAGADFEICINAAPIALTGAQPAQGNWSGEGVIAGVFDPLSAGLGQKILTYSFTDAGGCPKSDNIAVMILPEPELIVGDDISVCENEFPLNLLEHVSIKGGAFMGTGVTGSIFNPTKAGVGTHVISYTVRFNGCDLVNFRSITVNAAAQLSIGENITICEETSPFDLIKDVNILGGTFSGDGVDGSIFRPSVAGVGSHVIRYNYVNSFGCNSSTFRVVTIQEELPVSAGDDLALCNSVGNFDLTGRGSPEGGLFVGPGITNNVFNPSITGVGNFKIEYVVDNGNGCVSDDEITIQVKPSSLVNFGRDTIICVTTPPFNLNETPGLAGGTWSGEGVVANIFYPTLAGVGIHPLNFNISTLQCDIAGRRTITVTGIPQAATSDLSSASGCVDSFVELSAKIAEQDRANNVTIGWFRNGVEKPFASGERLLFQVKAQEEIFYRAMNAFGCTSGQNDFIRIRTDNPTGDFYTEDLTIPFGKPIQFFPFNVQNAQTYRWDFGDGLYSTEKYPYKYYYEEGQFNVSLTLASSTGCESVITKSNYITVLPEPGRELERPGNSGGRTSSETFSVTHSPNPHRGKFTIEIIAPGSGEFKLTAMDFVGHHFTLGDYSLFEGTNQIEIDMSDFKPGVYSIVILGNNTSLNFKTVKQ